MFRLHGINQKKELNVTVISARYCPGLLSIKLLVHWKLEHPSLVSDNLCHDKNAPIHLVLVLTAGRQTDRQTDKTHQFHRWKYLYLTKVSPALLQQYRHISVSFLL